MLLVLLVLTDYLRWQPIEKGGHGNLTTAVCSGASTSWIAAAPPFSDRSLAASHVTMERLTTPAIKQRWIDYIVDQHTNQ
jgi:hypothetical protein